MSSSGNITGTVFQLLGISGTSAVTPGSGDVLPPTIELAVGTVLKGVANGRTPEGATLIRTEIGDLSLNTDIFLKRGVEVAVQIERRQQDAFVRLVSIDGKSVPKYIEQQSAQSVPTEDTVQTSTLGSASRSSAAPSSAIITPESVIPARVDALLLSRPPSASLPLSAASTLPSATPAPPVAAPLHAMLSQSAPGSRLTLEVLGITFPQSAAPASTPSGQTPLPTPTGVLSQPPATGNAAPAGFTAPASPAAPPAVAAYQRTAQSTGIPPLTPGPSVAIPPLPAAPAATPLAPAAGAGSVSPLPATAASLPGSLPMAADATALPQGPSSLPAAIPPPRSPLPEAARPAINAAPAPTASHSPLPGPPVFSAMVLGDSGPGELILQTPVGTLKLLNTPALPHGAQLQMRISEILPAAELPVEDALSSLALRGAKPSRWEALEAFAAMAATLPRMAGASHLPTAGKHTLSDVLFLLAALKGGDLRRFIGEARTKEMETSAPDLLARLGAEFTALRGMAIESADPQGWNLHTLPFLASGQLEPVRLYHKRNRKGADGPQAGDSEHFLVDMYLSSFGQFQLDGFVKRQTPLQFDLAVRTERPLAKAVERDISHIYQEAAAISGYQGSLTFQHGPKACVTPPITRPAESAGDHSILV